MACWPRSSASARRPRSDRHARRLLAVADLEAVEVDLVRNAGSCRLPRRRLRRRLHRGGPGLRPSPSTTDVSWYLDGTTRRLHWPSSSSSWHPCFLAGGAGGAGSGARWWRAPTRSPSSRLVVTASSPCALASGALHLLAAWDRSASRGRVATASVVVRTAFTRDGWPRRRCSSTRPGRGLRAAGRCCAPRRPWSDRGPATSFL